MEKDFDIIEEEEEIEDEDQDQDQDQDQDEGISNETQRILAENARLKSQNDKLKLKKRSAIDKSSRKSVYMAEMEAFYQLKKEQELFQSENPGIDYEVVQAISQRKGVTMDEAMSFLGTAGKTMVGREVTAPKTKTTDYLEARKKALGLI